MTIDEALTAVALREVDRDQLQAEVERLTTEVGRLTAEVSRLTGEVERLMTYVLK